MMKVGRVLACGAVGVAMLGAALGGYLALPAEMSVSRPAPAVITARDPNYVAYLRMLASLGPAPARRAAPARARWDVEPRRARDAAQERWIEVDEDDDRWEALPTVSGRPAYSPDVVIYYAAPPVEDYIDEPPRRPAAVYPAPWRAGRPPPPPAYGRGWDTGEPLPPPPPRPSGY